MSSKPFWRQPWYLHRERWTRAGQEPWKPSEPLPRPSGPDVEPRLRCGTSAWTRFKRVLVCAIIVGGLSIAIHSIDVSVFQGRTSPQDGIAIRTAYTLAATTAAIVGLYNFVRMIFRMLANIMA
jgi:hypothetical protein